MTAARRRAPLAADLRIVLLGILGFLLQCLKSIRRGSGSPITSNVGTKEP
jgi:hypothetical protein